MKTRVAFAVFCTGTLVLASSVGTVPRSAAAQYSAHATSERVSIGAVKLNLQQVRKTFTSDLNRCCVVLEVAIFPEKDHPANISLGDFSLRVVNAENAVRPSSAKLVASSLQQKAGSDREVTVSPSVGVGYETGTYTDPDTGTRQHSNGVYTSAGVGVGVGNSGDQPGSTEADRKTMELELSEKGLPEGTTSAPVAGHLYFPIAKKKNAQYQLEYTVDGKKVVLPLPE
jgi:hypothetical protein